MAYSPSPADNDDDGGEVVELQMESIAFFSSSVAKLRPFKSGQRKKLRKW
ncbi:hypothetical protein OsI_19203 [Oryza sativa Indica Group]|uniref:Uncharacterized protein n=1 Tax=Oryza sativa subsp. indica TaxID=39946 RepID=A2Y2H6_ORYSI|nr:hypothetical protein OsI_19203 [Oryza sativa Indica Group]